LILEAHLQNCMVKWGHVLNKRIKGGRKTLGCAHPSLSLAQPIGSESLIFSSESKSKFLTRGNSKCKATPLNSI